jgi:hypothetical protein
LNQLNHQTHPAGWATAIAWALPAFRLIKENVHATLQEGLPGGTADLELAQGGCDGRIGAKGGAGGGFGLYVLKDEPACDFTSDGPGITKGGSGVLKEDGQHLLLAIMKLLTASNPAVGLWSLPFKDKLRVLRTLALVQVQAHQKIKPYQQLRYWSNVPFRHGPNEVVKQSATPLSGNPARHLDRSNPNALQDELNRHLKEDGKMSGFDFGLQFLDADRMTYWGQRRDIDFWMENASLEWKEEEAPFHTVARLTLLSNSHLRRDVAEPIYFDVTGHSTPDSMPVGSINRARWQGEVASRKARNRVDQEVAAVAS